MRNSITECNWIQCFRRRLKEERGRAPARAIYACEADPRRKALHETPARGSLSPVPAAAFQRTPDGAIRYRGELFPGFNKPKRAPKGDPKKYVVLGKQGAAVAKVKFGQRGYEDFLQHRDTKRRANFKSRHNCDTAKDKTTARYWACNHNW